MVEAEQPSVDVVEQAVKSTEQLQQEQLDELLLRAREARREQLEGGSRSIE